MSTFNEEYYDEENTPFLDIVNQDRALLDLDLFPTFDDMLLWFARDITIVYEDPVTIRTYEDPVIIRPINVVSPDEEEETDNEETDEEEEDLTQEHTPNLYYSG